MTARSGVTAPRGFRAAGISAGIKASGDPDLALVVNDGPADAAAAVFTTNRIKAAPVRWSEQVLRSGRLTAVVVDKFEEAEGPKGLLRLYCTIFVERDSQKPIVIGRRGEMIKQIGTAARQELERFFDTKVFLDLHVKVKSEWREDERVLNELFNRPS